MIRLTERDYLIFRELVRWRFCLGRHIRILANFSSARSCDRRLKLLVENEFLCRKKTLYGVPYIYTLSKQGTLLIHNKYIESKIRVEQIMHDIAVLDTAIYMNKVYKIPFSQMKTEKQLHSADGFSQRKHQPDFTVSKTKNHEICIEIELSLKAKKRLTKNIQDNFFNYGGQIWIIPKEEMKIREIVKDSSKLYNNIKIIDLEVIQEYAKSIT